MTGPAPSLDDFSPPYRLGAFGCTLVGMWKGAPAPKDIGGGFEPVRLLGRPVGAALVLHYDRPSEAHPVVYSEVILAHLARRGLELVAVPFDLVLDNAFFVEAGLRYYHLPKRLDATLRVELVRDARGRPSRMTTSGGDLDFGADLEPIVFPGVTPIASTVMRVVTGRLPVIGTSSEPLLRATIRLAPDERPAYAARVARFVSGSSVLEPFAAFFWPSLAVEVGVPTPFSP